MRTVELKLGGKSYGLPVTFEMGEVVEDKFGDPFMVMSDMLQAQQASAAGIPYKRRWEADRKTMTQFFELVLGEMGEGLSFEDIKRMIWNDGQQDAVRAYTQWFMAASLGEGGDSSTEKKKSP